MYPRSMKNLLFIASLIVLPVFAASDVETKSLDSLRQSAEQGSVDAQYELGILYEFGYNFPDHKASAYVWYVRAAEQGNPLAAKRRDVLKPQLNQAAIERAQVAVKAKPDVATTPPAPATSTTQ